MTRKILIKSEF